MPALRRCPALALPLALWAGGCVSEQADADLQEASVLSQGTLMIQLGGGELTEDQRVLAEFYRNVLARMQDAYADSDLQALRALLQSYDRPGAPDWAEAQLRHFRALAGGLAFEQHCQNDAALELPDRLPALGAPLRLRLVVPPMPQAKVRLGGEGSGDPVAFGVLFRVEDRDPMGAVRTQDTNDLFRLPESFELDENRGLSVPLEFQVDAGSAAVRRVSVWVELLPGYVEVGGLRAPIRRRPLGHVEAILYPKNVEAVRARPLLTLREAMRRGDPEHFAHVYLAATFLAGEQRETGMEMLMQWVRLGSEERMRVATAALQAMTGTEVPVGDRQGWLQWWQRRKDGR